MIQVVLQPRIDETFIYGELASSLNKEVVSYSILKVNRRPFSWIFRLRLNFSDKKGLVVYLKIYHKDNNSLYNTINVENEYLTTKFWYEYFKGSPSYGVIKPICFNPAKRIIVTEESQGENLGQYIFKRARFVPSFETKSRMFKLVSNTGGWLRLFQSANIDENVSHVSIKQILEYINLRLNRIVENPMIDFTSYHQKMLNDYILNLWENVPEHDKYVSHVHSDFSPSNILVQNEKIIVMDFNKIDYGSPFQDLSRFYHQLSLLKNKPIYQTKIIDELMESFLNGYGDATINKKPMFKIYLMVHTINHLGKTARYWEHSFVENLYNRLIVRNTLKNLHSIVKDL